MSNAIGFVDFGNFGHRTLLLLDCPELKALEEEDDVWLAVERRARRIVLGTVDMEVKDGAYRVTSAVSKDGYGKMLKELTSGLVSLEGVRRVDFLGHTLRTRSWGPFRGARRRGQKAIQKLKRRFQISEDHMEELLTRIKVAFFHFFTISRTD